jgi:hypothetical protein
MILNIKIQICTQSYLQQSTDPTSSCTRVYPPLHDIT